jgi:uncharacterized membrane protein YeaQ/YmgE (transglycosylase-associated protein family)
MGIFATLVVGLLAGWITGMLMKGHYSIWIDMLLGIIGGFVGGWLTSLVFGANLMTGINITSLIVAIVGAVIVVVIYRLIRGRAVV